MQRFGIGLLCLFLATSASASWFTDCKNEVQAETLSCDQAEAQVSTCLKNKYKACKVAAGGPSTACFNAWTSATAAMQAEYSRCTGGNGTNSFPVLDPEAPTQ